MESKFCHGLLQHANEHGRYGQSCTLKLWSAQAMLSLYGMLEYVV